MELGLYTFADVGPAQRFLAQISVGTMEHDKVMRAIELFGTGVAPAVREELRRRRAGARIPRLRF
jgi:hypothetical protein